MLARRSLVAGLLLLLALPALAIGPRCACPIQPATHSCCRSSASPVSFSAPRGCCSAALPASAPDADLRGGAVAPRAPELGGSDAALAAERAPAPSAPRMTPLAHPDASESPPDLPVRNCVLRI